MSERNSSGKGIRVKGRGHAPTLAQGRQNLGKGRREFVATNSLRPARGRPTPLQLGFEFVATDVSEANGQGKEKSNERETDVQAGRHPRTVRGRLQGKDVRPHNSGHVGRKLEFALASRGGDPAAVRRTVKATWPITQ